MSEINDPAPRSVELTRTATGRYTARNPAGAEITFGRGDDLMSPVDLLLASTGLGPLSRYVLTAGWSTTGRAMTSMFPVRVAGRLLLLAAIPGGDGGTWTLQHATPLGNWRTLGRLVVDSWEDDDEDLHFDPIGNRLPGSHYPPVLAALRDPSYPAQDSAAPRRQ